MGPGVRHDAINDHWSFWNWGKLVSLADTLRRRLDKALEQQIIQREALEEFSQQQRDRVKGWRKMVHDFEEDGTKKNPYEVVFVGLTENQVRLQFQNDEEEQARQGVPVKHQVTPSTFVAECLEVEENQREVRVQAELKKAKTTVQQIDLGTLRTKLIRRLQRLRKLQQTYSPASIMALENRKALEDEHPEDELLFLPSSLLVAERAGGGCADGLLEMELLMRDAQCRASLVKLRNQLVIKARFLNYKKLHSRHVGANTRARTIVDRNETKIRLHSEKYQAAWNALFVCNGRIEGAFGWKQLKKGDIRCMEDADDVKKKEEKRKRAAVKRKRKYQELLAHGEDLQGFEEDMESEGEGEGGAGRGESTREVSWIWTAAGMTGTDAGLEDALRIEWAKAYARSRRWDEEVRLLREEFRRLPISLEFEADIWARQAKRVPEMDELDQAYAEGMVAYALKQQAMFLELAARARETETAPRLEKGKKRARAPVVDPLMDAMNTAAVPFEEEEGDDDGDGDVALGAEDDGDGDDYGLLESDEELVMGGELDDV
ncbi:hypothetical protein MVEN_00736200 [Mycena venus]|uniref:Uncharacterized protein n=1 Tax=Mycena venus TaxID=2733690 RepID=A0A8H6YKS1_9AGAR|nr:hypothetical protein MVEN_00736200 [Mycena venus]